MKIIDLNADGGIGANSLYVQLGDFHLVKFLDAEKRMLVRRVLVIELMLDQARQAAKFGEKLSQQADLMHRAQRRGDVPSFVQYFQKRFAHMRVFQE